MSLATLIANTRKVLASDAAKGHVVFAAQGRLVGVTEVNIRTGCYGVDDKVRPGLSAVRVEVTVAGPESEER